MLFSMILFIGLTDILDGYIARKFNQKTFIGAWLDSIADFVFYLSLILYMIIFDFEYLINLKYLIIIIMSIKIFSLIICFLKYKKLGFLHIWGNKVSGIIAFIGICFFVLTKNIIVIKTGLYVSMIFSLEELAINIIGKEYNPNIKGVYEIIKQSKNEK
jgi:CDP-diacylglycerol--glycerol-3-phosphate 3-phosphatidyltransferase